MNPFGIGPFGALFLTCFITVAVCLCVALALKSTEDNIRRICDTVVLVWEQIARIADAVLAAAKKQPPP